MDKLKLMQTTVARESRPPEPAGWWLMNRKEDGWASSVRGLAGPVPGRPLPFPSLHVLLDHVDAELGVAGRDEHGIYVEVRPRLDRRGPPSSSGAGQR